MATAFDPVAVITTGITTLTTSLEGVSGPALALGAGITAMFFGWKLVKKFSKG